MSKCHCGACAGLSVADLREILHDAAVFLSNVIAEGAFVDSDDMDEAAELLDRIGYDGSGELPE